MEPESNLPKVTEASTSHLLPYDFRELEKVSGYSTKKEAQALKLSDDVDGMGRLRLLWDSKVPEKNKKFYNFVSFSSSNQVEILAEIQKYIDFYKELRTAASTVSNMTEETDSEEANPFLMIVNLNEHLTTMVEAAELGKGTTNSSVVYNLHRAFVARHEKLENMIRRVECIAFKKGMKKANDGWQESTRVLRKVTEEWENSKERYEDMCTKFDRLMNAHEKLLEKQKE